MASRCHLWPCLTTYGRASKPDNSHSPFRQHKTRDKHEIDRMTMTMSIDMPDSFSIELRSFLTGLLQRDVPKRLGCRGRGADEIKSHPFFRGIDWRVVYLQRLSPPLIPARGEVNAADAFDIGSFDDEDTKHIKLTEADQELYRNFPVVVSERWQHEISETIFDYINHEADKAEMKRKNKNKLGYQEEEQSDCILHGYVKRLGGTFTATWLTRYVRLYPNRLELWSDSGKQPELIFMDQIEEVCNDFVQIKNEQCIVIKLYNHSKYVLTNSDEIGLKEWHSSLKAAHRESVDMMTTMAEKATKIYGTEIPLKHMGKRRQQLQQENAAAMAGASPAAPSWEQKIIQKELQASSSGKQQVVLGDKTVAANQTRTNNTNELDLGSTANAASVRSRDQKLAQTGGHAHQHHHHHHHHRTTSAQDGSASGQSADLQQPHKHHRAHYSHRSHHHHHRHHHHHHHEAVSADGGPQQVAAAANAHRPHHHGGHHVRSAGHSASRVSSSASTRHADQKTGAADGVERAQKEAKPELPEVGQVEPKPAPSLDKQVDVSVSSEDKDNDKQSAMGEPKPNDSEERQESSSKPEQKPPVERTGNLDEAPVEVQPPAKTSQRAESLLSSSSSASEVGSASGSSGSRSSCSSLDAPVDGESELGVDKLQLADGPNVVEGAEQGATDQLVGQPKDKPHATMAPSNEPADLSGQKQPRIKLAVSLENVSDQQEVLRDPSKRITSDNKQREQDLVAQYEKLNFSARNSSSSQENDETLTTKTKTTQSTATTTN